MLRALDAEVEPMARKHVALVWRHGIRSSGDLPGAATDNRQPTEVRAAAIRLIAMFKLRRAGSIVEDIFRRSADPLLIWESAMGVALLRRRGAKNLFARALSSAQSIERRTAAAYALGLLGDPKGIRPLIERLQVSRVASRELAHIIEALGLLKAQSAMSLLIPLVQHRSPEVRAAAQYAVTEIRAWSLKPSRTGARNRAG